MSRLGNGVIAKLCPHLQADLAMAWGHALADAAEEFGIVDGTAQSIWLANLLHESRKLLRLVEDMPYTATWMVQTYPSRYAEIPHAIELGANARAKQLAAAGPQAVANDVYANQMGNGPDYTGDGWLFRGRYPVMLSGRALYTHCHAEIGVPNPLNPDALLSDIPAMARVSAWFWQHKELSVIANSSGDLRDVRRAWNGSLVGLDEVSLLYRDALIATGLA